MVDKIRLSSLEGGTDHLPETEVQVLGFGIAGLGLAVAADREGCLSELLNSGLIYIDKRAPSEFDSLRFDIFSNSPAADFLAGVCEQGIFKSLLHSREGERLLQAAHNTVPLTEVADFFKRMSERLQQELGRYPNSNFLSGKELGTLRVLSDGRVLSLDTARRPIAISRKALVALGGTEVLQSSVIDFALEQGAKCCCSESVLRGQQESGIQQLLQEGKQIAVVGGGHSAFSVAEYLIRCFGQQLKKEQILLINRSPVKVFHKNLATFDRETFGDETGLVDPESGEINRFCGLRGDAKAAYFAVWQGEESRVKILTCSTLQQSEFLQSHKDIGLVVQATGYSHNTPNIENCQGEVQPDTALQSLALSKEHCVTTNNSQARLSQIYGLGLGCFSSRRAPFTSTGEVPVGVNIYHREHASIVLKQILSSREVAECSTPLSEAKRVAGSEV